MEVTMSLSCVIVLIDNKLLEAYLIDSPSQYASSGSIG